MAKPGRPKGSGLLYTDELAAEICRRIGEGETLQSICLLDGMPAVRTVNDWTVQFPAFGADFAQARARGFDAIAAQTLEIADDARNDFMKQVRGGAEVEVLDTEHIQRSKLRIETRLKLLAKWDPKRYGERTTLAGDPDNPLTVINKVERTIVKPK